MQPTTTMAEGSAGARERPMHDSRDGTFDRKTKNKNKNKNKKQKTKTKTKTKTKNTHMHA